MKDIRLPGELGKFLDNPVGYIPGVKSSGPCNGVVFSDIIRFTGQQLENLAYEPTDVSDYALEHIGSVGRTLLTRSTYTDEETHNEEICGRIAHTDVRFAIEKCACYHLAWWGTLKGKMRSTFPDGIRKFAPTDDQTVTVKAIFGLRN